MTLLLALGIAFLGSLGKSLFDVYRNPFKPITSTALFKEIEYIQHLQLVSHYSEEIILLGTTDRLKQVVRSRKAGVNKQKRTILQLEDSISQLLTRIEIRSSWLAQSQADWQAREAKWKTQNIHYQELLKHGTKPLKRKYASRDSLISDDRVKNIVDAVLPAAKLPVAAPLLEEFLTKRQEWDSLYQAFYEKPWQRFSIWEKKKRRGIKNELQNHRDSIKEEMMIPFGLLIALMDRELQNEWQEIKDSLFNKRELKSKQVEVTKAWADKLSIYRKQHKQAQNKLHLLEEELSEAETELFFAEANGITEDPELLIILPAEVAVYIDLADILINGIHPAPFVNFAQKIVGSKHEVHRAASCSRHLTSGIPAGGGVAVFAAGRGAGLAR